MGELLIDYFLKAIGQFLEKYSDKKNVLGFRLYHPGLLM